MRALGICWIPDAKACAMRPGAMMPHRVVIRVMLVTPQLLRGRLSRGLTRTG